MQAGTIYGFTGLVKYITQKMKEESGFTNAKVIATGGLSELVTEVYYPVKKRVSKAQNGRQIL